MRFLYVQPLVCQSNSVDKCERRRMTRISGRCSASRSHSISQIPLGLCGTTKCSNVSKQHFLHRGNLWARVTVSIQSSVPRCSLPCISNSTRRHRCPVIRSYSHPYRHPFVLASPRITISRQPKPITKVCHASPARFVIVPSLFVFFLHIYAHRRL